MKTYVLIISKNFLKKHPKAGKPTFFKELIRFGDKKHTIRSNTYYWAKVAEQVNAGKAVLSIRQWTGRPYMSKQVEIMQLKSMHVQTISMHKFSKFSDMISWQVEGRKSNSPLITIAHNDGFNDMNDFYRWFFPDKKPEDIFEGCIIHFTDLEY